MIELRGVSKTVSSGDSSLTILHPVDLSIAASERVAIVGPSGSGKSTLSPNRPASGTSVFFPVS